jgi:hypothetical protein
MNLLDAAKYRNRAALALEAFQHDDAIGPADRREAGFECFVRAVLDTLEERTQLKSFGLRVVSDITVDHEAGAPCILVTQKVSALEEGLTPSSVDIEAFFTEFFPRNAVFEGTFALGRTNELVRRYVTARAENDDNEQLAVIAILSRAAEAAFSPASLRFLIRKA